MRSNYIYFSVLLLVVISCSHDDSNRYQITLVTNTVNHDRPDTLVEFIESASGAPDLHLFNLHYNIPGDLPKSFTSTTHSDAEITTIYHPNNTNYRFKKVITYDSAYNVIQYALFPCIISSTGGYNYFVTYNENGQIISIKDSVQQILSRRDRYEMEYFENGDLRTVRKYGPYSNGNTPSHTITVTGRP